MKKTLFVNSLIHMKMKFSLKKKTAVQKTESNSTVSADSGKSMHTATVEKLSYKDAASNLSNIGTTVEKAKTQSRLRQKTLN